MMVPSGQTIHVDDLQGRKPGIVPKMWSEEEDALLRNAIATYGEKAWKVVAKQVPGRTYIQCLQRWKKALKPGLRKGHWSEAEDEKLLALIDRHQPNLDWALIAKSVEGRSAKQCRERWCLNLDPSINHGPWSAEEDHELMEFVRLNGGKWSLIAKYMPGRTENSVKTRYYSIQRKEARRKRWTEDEDSLIVDTVLANGRDFDLLDSLMKHRTKGQIKKRYTWLVQRQPELLKRVRSVEDNLRSKKRKAAEPHPDSLLRSYSTGLLAPTPEFTSEMSNMSIDLNLSSSDLSLLDQPVYPHDITKKPRSRLIRKTISTAILEDLIKPDPNTMFPLLDPNVFNETEDSRYLPAKPIGELRKMNSLEMLHTLLTDSAL